jgi:hypothetical protein
MYGRDFAKKVNFKINKNDDFGGFQLQKLKKKKKKIAKFIYLVFIVEFKI